MAEDTKGQTPEEEKPTKEVKRKAPSRPPAIDVNTSFRVASVRVDPLHDNLEESDKQ